MLAWTSRWRGTGLKTRLLHPVDEFWDRRFGIHTFGYLPAVGESNQGAWQGHYEPTSYRDLFKLLGRVDVGPSDHYVDLGCGLGRTVFAARWLGARRATGVEIDPGLALACRENLTRSRQGPERIEFIEGPAQSYALADTTVLFLYHPFGRGTLQSVLDRLAASLRANPRRCRLVYFNAVADDTLAASGLLRRVDRWEAGVDWSPTTGGYPASFWEA